MRARKQLRYPALLAVALNTTPSFAQDACRRGMTEVLSVEKYEARKAQNDFFDSMELSVTLRNISGRGIRMFDGSIVFQDVLGRDIIRIGIDPDHKIAADTAATQTGTYSNLRLLDVSPEDVIATVCVRGMVFEDGEIFKAGDQ